MGLEGCRFRYSLSARRWAVAVDSTFLLCTRGVTKAVRFTDEPGKTTFPQAKFVGTFNPSWHIRDSEFALDPSSNG